MMKNTTYCKANYTMTPQGNGQYHVTKETSKGIQHRHSTDSFVYDWMDEPEQKAKFQAARKRLQRMFTKQL